MTLQDNQSDLSGVERTATGEIVDQGLKPDPTLTPSKETETEKETPASKDTTKDGKESILTEKGEKDKPAAAPDKYETFKVPDGFDLDTAVSEEASGIFKGLNLSQSQAQSLVDFYVKHTTEAAQAPVKTWQDQQETWRTEIKADPEIGGKLDEVRTTVSKAIDGLGDPKLANDFREAMTYTGAGNNPAFIRAFYKLAQKVTEGGPIQGRNPSKFGQRQDGKPVSQAQAMYPHLP